MMKKVGKFKKTKTNFTSICFCTSLEYSNMVTNNKIDKNTTYFIDNSWENECNNKSMLEENTINTIWGEIKK